MTIVTTLIGIIVTILVSNVYYKKSFKKSLTPYIQFVSDPLEGIDSEVRRDLKIQYQDHEIENINEIQFLIANTGDKAIRDIIEPLSLRLPTKKQLLDATILYVNPEGRKVETEIIKEKNQVSFLFPLLNSGDFFITKLLVNGKSSQKDFNFTIISDELPPTLSAEYIPYDSIITSKKESLKDRFVLSLSIAGVIVFLIGLSITKVIYDHLNTIPSFKKLGFVNFIMSLSISNWSLLITTLPAILFLILGIMMIASSFTSGSFPPPKKKFIVPDNEKFCGRNRYKMMKQII